MKFKDYVLAFALIVCALFIISYATYSVWVIVGSNVAQKLIAESVLWAFIVCVGIKISES